MGGVGVETIQSSERQDTPARENKPRTLTQELCWFQLATRGARPGERAAGEWLRVRQPRRAVPPDPGRGAHAQGRSTNSVTSSPALPAHVRVSSVCAALPEDDRTVRALEPQDDASLRISKRQQCDVILWRLDSILEPWNPPSTVAAHAAPASLQPPHSLGTEGKRLEISVAVSGEIWLLLLPLLRCGAACSPECGTLTSWLATPPTVCIGA